MTALSHRLTGTAADVPLLMERARARRLSAQWDPARADLALALGHDPAAAAALDELGLLEAATGNHGAALAAWARAVTLSTEALRARAQILAARQAHAGAEADLARILERGPDVDAAVELSRLQQAAGRPQDASATCHNALRRAGAAPVLVTRCVRLDVAAGRFDEALAHLDLPMERARNPVEWRLLRADVLAARGATRQAQAERALAVDDASRAAAARPTALNQLQHARALHAAGRVTEARAALERARTAAPRLPGVAELARDLGGE
ncbi:MAG: hypothetical protein HY904_11360 [Deltaproteobacteria bacterium]|nr:hypothetical protein [Deltaproteobacteria bacterium]